MMKKWLPSLAASRHVITPDRTDLFKEFHDPLAYMDAGSIKRLRNRCIRVALTYTITGAVLIAVVIWSSGRGSWGHHGGRGGGQILVFALFFYGIFRLCTIKRTMISNRRDEIAIKDILDRKAPK
jgi:hypothetical protein